MLNEASCHLVVNELIELRLQTNVTNISTLSCNVPKFNYYFTLFNARLFHSILCQTILLIKGRVLHFNELMKI
jgi:hypothetical protein